MKISTKNHPDPKGKDGLGCQDMQLCNSGNISVDQKAIIPNPSHLNRNLAKVSFRSGTP